MSFPEEVPGKVYAEGGWSHQRDDGHQAHNFTQSSEKDGLAPAIANFTTWRVMPGTVGPSQRSVAPTATVIARYFYATSGILLRVIGASASTRVAVVGVEPLGHVD